MCLSGMCRQGSARGRVLAPFCFKLGKRSVWVNWVNWVMSLLSDKTALYGGSAKDWLHMDCANMLRGSCCKDYQWCSLGGARRAVAVDAHL